MIFKGGQSPSKIIGILDDAIDGHVNWIKQLKIIVDNEEMQAIQQDGNRCEFGHYYNAINITNKALKDEWESIDCVHQELHEKSAQVERAIEQEDFNGARAVYAEAQSLSDQVLDIFKLISGKIETMDRKGEAVF